MNRREKLLAAAVIGLVAILGLGYAVNSLWTAYSARQAEIVRLKGKLDDHQRKLHQAAQAEKRLRVYRQMSLPSERQLAGSLYREWLNQTVHATGATQVSIDATASRAQGKGITPLAFSVKCHVNLEQLTKLLFQFYSTDQLHRVKTLSIRPIPDSKEFDLALNVEALSLAKAENETKLNDQSAHRLQHGDLAAYTEKILGRNLFAPANRAPKIASLGRQSANPNRPLSLAIKASDPDKLDQVTYKLADDQPLAGAKLDPKSGQFQWTPKDKGEFAVTVIATDDGYPSRSDRQTIKIVVADPPPPPPTPKKKLDFDNAKHTVLTGITTDKAGRIQAWLRIKPTDETLFLIEGDKIDVGSVQGTITHISDRGAEVETEEKKFFISIGQNLLEGLSLPSGEP